MPRTIKKRGDRQIIGGVFSNRKNADKAIQAFHDLGVEERDIHMTVTINDTARKGKIRVVVHNVRHPAGIIEIFDDCKAIYNIDGSRNFREDVAGLTAGAAAGAAAGGFTGTCIAGPIGTAVGAAAGAVVGGALGAAAGEVAEHHK